LAKTFSSVTGEMTPYTSSYGSNVNNDLNFGQKPFKFPPPAGFQPLNAANVRPSTIVARPDQYVGVTTYTGTSANPATITSDDFSFTPDFVWVKSRSNAESHALYDSIRGATYRLRSDTTGGETTGANELQSFIPGGFTAGNNGHIYFNNYTYVAWCWKAGGSKNTFNIDDVGYATASAAGLTDGTITPTGASVNTKSGFSIIGYTGTDNASDTFSHGLTKKPDFAIFKNRSQNGDDWIVYHSSQGATKRGKLNLPNAFDSQISQFNDTEPTSSIFTIGTFDNINKLNSTYIAYLWAEIPGFSKFGSYTHNNSTDGPFIELGFKPALILIKKYNVTGRSWVFIDSERDKFNVAKYNLWPNLTNGDTTTYDVLDILSNGFKVRTNTNGWVGESTDQYIYAAWAEAPAFNLYGAQSNAR
jgi:hypothetical protein